ncbi:helix-turn-helix transcriptional regulator [Tardiphaga sp.]|uniref:helix-turn-helix transcriptional regulator n=1 Tax=Tardiphaga sp. TaxID=1926292 RepID=UPI00352A0FD2
MFSPDKMTRSAFHQDFLRRYDLGTQLTLSSRQLVPGSTFFLASQRTRSADLPSPEERKAMEVLSSHAIRALQVYRSVASPQLSRELLSDVLAHLPTGIIVTDHNSRVVFMNRQAEALDGDGFRVDRGQIFASMLRDQPALTQLIADTAASRVKAAEVRPVVLQRPSLRKPLVIRAVPISGKSDRPLAHVLRGLDLVLLTISDPEGVSDGAPLDELVALGLTATEAVIAFMLGTGSSPEEIAEVREIALSTVRTHIRRIYSKFHIARQGELAKIVSAIKRVI